MNSLRRPSDNAPAGRPFEFATSYRTIYRASALHFDFRYRWEELVVLQWANYVAEINALNMQNAVNQVVCMNWYILS